MAQRGGKKAMTMILKRSLLLLVLVLFAPVVAHSQGTQVSGGGWIRGANGGKATFDVDMDDDGTGNFAYQDKGFRSSNFPRGVNIDGIIDSVFQTGTETIEAFGTYTAYQDGISGYFKAIFRDTGNKGPQKGDSLNITLCADPYCTVPYYDNFSVLGDGRKGGGNITVSGAGTNALIVFSTLLVGWAFWRRR